jgi:Ca2+-binding EF-hand superfamily protein
MSRGVMRAARALAAALCLVLAAGPALAQDAPPHEGEGLPAKSAGKSKPAAKPAAKSKPTAKSAAQNTSKPAAKGKAAAPAARSDSKPGAKPASGRDGDKRYLRSLDTNHDGRISREEYLAGPRKRFSEVDANHDGVISQKEAKAARQKQDAKRAKADAKRRAQGKPVKERKAGAKKSSRQSLTSGAESGKSLRENVYLERRKKKFAEMDLNHDGVISREESRLAKQRQLERREEKRAKAKATRLRKMEEARAKGASADAPEVILPASPPPAQPKAPSAAPPAAPMVPAVPDAEAQPAT